MNFLELLLCWIPLLSSLFGFCRESSCDGVDCGINAQCVEGVCQCLPTFGGDPNDACDPVSFNNPFKDVGLVETMEVEGGSLTKAPTEDSGEPLSTMPGITTMTSDELSELEELPFGKIILVDTEFVPYGLAELLRNESLLFTDGSLTDFQGNKANTTLLMSGKVYEVNPDVDEPLRRKLANPYPWRWFSWNLWNRYDGGFCRSWHAGSYADAWGPVIGGSRPHTNIQSIETRVTVGNRNDNDICFNCDRERSRAEYKIGCFWPAFGWVGGTHYVSGVDYGLSAGMSWGWSN